MKISANQQPVTQATTTATPFDEEAKVKELARQIFAPQGDNGQLNLDAVSITEYTTIRSSGIQKADIENSNGEDIGDLLKITDEVGNTHFVIKSHAANKPSAQNGCVVYDGGTDLQDGKGTMFWHSGTDVDITDSRKMFTTRQLQGSDSSRLNNVNNTGDLQDRMKYSRYMLNVNDDGSVFDPTRERIQLNAGVYTYTPESFEEKFDTLLQQREEDYKHITGNPNGWDENRSTIERNRLLKDILQGRVAGIEMPDTQREYYIQQLQQSQNANQN